MTRSQQFLQVATLVETSKTSPMVKDWLKEARQDFGVSCDSVAALLDRTQWTAEKPQIRISASINQRGSLTVRWLPTIGALEAEQPDDFEFDSKFLGQVVVANEPYFQSRPMGELQWFRNVPRSLYGDSPEDKGAILAIVYGISARYEELVDELSSHLTVTHVTSLSVESDGKEFINWRFGQATA